MTDVSTSGQGPSVVAVSSKTNRRRRSCLRSLFCPRRRGRSRKVGLEPTCPAAAIVESPIRKLCRDDEEPSEWHMPIDWAVDVKDPPKANAEGGKAKFGGDFFSLKPFQTITTNIIPKKKKSVSSGSQAGSRGGSRKGNLIESLRRYSRQSSRPASSKEVSIRSDSSKFNNGSPSLLSPIKAMVRILSYSANSRSSSFKTAPSPVLLDPSRAESLTVISPIPPSSPCPTPSHTPSPTPSSTPSSTPNPTPTSTPSPTPSPAATVLQNPAC